MVCVSRSRMRRGSLTHFCTYTPEYILSSRNITSCSVSQKVDTELCQAPTSQAKSRDQTTHGPHTWGGEDSTLSVHRPPKFGHDPCPVRRGLVAAIKRCAREARFFRSPGRLWNRTRGAEKGKPEPCVGFNTTKGETCFVFGFPIP